MKKDEHYSEEQLNAFVDGELDPEEKSRVYNESERSPDLDQRLCRQRKIKDLVQHAYKSVPPPSRSGGTPLTTCNRYLLTSCTGRVAVAELVSICRWSRY